MIITPNAAQSNPVFGDLLTNLDKYHQDIVASCGGGAVTASPADVAFDVYSLLDSNTGYYHYDGGLTTPPCSEVVWWNLADTHVNVSPMQFNRFVNMVVGAMNKDTCQLKTVADPDTYSTSRPPVALGDRTLQRVCTMSGR
jgi:carbonic anhydrase